MLRGTGDFDLPDNGWRETKAYKDYIGLYIDETIEVDDRGNSEVLKSNTKVDNFTDGDDIISEVYNAEGFIIDDIESAIEKAYDFIINKAYEQGVDITEPGVYEIKTYATLVYDVDNIWRKTELDFEDAEIEFSPKESFIEDLKVKKLS